MSTPATIIEEKNMQEDLLTRRRRAMGPAYRLFYSKPVHLVRGEGVWLFDVDGKRYLDCYNNVASVGHCHPHVVRALSEQAATLNTHTRYLHEKVVRYAERLGATFFEATTAAAFSSAFKVTISRGRMLRARSCITISPAAKLNRSRIS